MKTALLTIIVFVCGCGAIDENYELANEPSNVVMPVYVMPAGAPTCGGKIPCVCGSILTSNRKMDANDNMANCSWNTPVPALYVMNGAKLDCSGHIISARLNNKGDYENDRTAIFVRYDSSGSAIMNCKIHGFSQAIYVEMRQDIVKKDGKSVFDFESPENLAFMKNEIVLGGGKCYMGSCGASNGIHVQGWPSNYDPPKNIMVLGNRFRMANSPKTDKPNFLHYGSYFMTTGAKNVQVWYNIFEDLHWGFGLRLLYGVEATVVGNVFKMPWERNKQTEIYKSKCSNWLQASPCTSVYWLPTGAAIELYNGTTYGYPTITVWFNAFFISEDELWPPTPFGNGTTNGRNHEHIVVRAGIGNTLPALDMRFNWWKYMDGTNYINPDLTRLVYDENYTVFNAKVEPDYREVKYLPRLY